MCLYKPKKPATFRDGLSRKHPEPFLDSMVDVTHNGNANSNDGYDSQDLAGELQFSLAFDKAHFNAIYTLSLQAEHNLSRCILALRHSWMCILEQYEISLNKS